MKLYIIITCTVGGEILLFILFFVKFALQDRPVPGIRINYISDPFAFDDACVRSRFGVRGMLARP